MYKKLSFGFVILAAVVLCAPVIVIAEESTTTAVPTATSLEPTTTLENSSPEAKAEQREIRIKEAKEKATNRISAAEEKKIAGLCKSAQSKIIKLQENAENILTNRQEKYKKTLNKLNELSIKLRTAGANTTELDASIVELESKTSEISETLTTYNTTLNDLSEMDCVSDPSGFKAALQSARTQRTENVQSSGSFKSYIKDTIKPILQSLKEQLNTTETNQTSGDGTN